MITPWHVLLTLVFVVGAAIALYAPTRILREDQSLRQSSQEYWRGRRWHRVKYMSIFLPISLMVIWAVSSVW